MKKLIKLSLMLVAAVAVATGCNCAKKMAKHIDTIDVNCTPEVLTLNNGEVAAEISVEIPEGYFSKKAVIRVTPVVVFDGGEVTAEPIMLQGESVAANYEVVPFDEASTITKSVSFKYSPEMRRSKLQLRIEAACNCEECEEFTLINCETEAPITKEEMEILSADPKSEAAQELLRRCGYDVAEGVNTLQSDIKYAQMMEMMKDNYKRVTTTVETADLVYGISSSTVNSKSLKSDDIAAFKALVAENTSNDRAKQTLFANGYASPDGPEAFNDKLSKSRSESGKKAMAKMLEEYGLDIDVAAYGEDWDGFKKLVEESNIEDKDLILQVLSLYDSSTQREQEIKNLAEVFGELKSEVLPQLRRAQMSNKIDLTGKSDEEMLAFVEAKNFGVFNVEEILHICNNLEVSAEQKVALLEYATEQFSDARAYNNLGVVYAKMGDAEKASSAFKSAIAAGAKGAEINKNMTLLNLMNGDVAEAEKFAQSSDAEAKSAVEAAKGNYTPATKEMSGYNAAIAYTQLGNYTAAKSEIGKCACPDSEYLLAVIASLEGDVKTAGAKLSSAVEKNSELAEKAASDVNLKNLYESGFELK